MGAKKLEEPLVKVEQVCLETGVSETFIKRARKDRGFPYHQLSSRTIRYRMSEVWAWLDERKKQ